MAIDSIDHAVELSSRRCGGIAAIAGAVLAIAGNTALLFINPVVSEDYLSYPVTPAQFRWGQVFFALTQALMAIGIYALVRSDAVRRTRSTNVFAALAVIGFAITAPGELVLILVADKPFDSTAVNAASTVFGIGLLIADIGLIGYGVAAVRARRWPRAWAALPLILGAFQLFVVTPLAIGVSFTSILTYAAIALADLLVAAIGVRLLVAD
ncbi:hypothetical protein [Kribbella sp. NPDC049584]|uniref:hypothetical protein n=1 Tax=Kribbella sp. NPDC049584 TaxID=3154833 RepID=UPI003417E304